MTTKSTKADFKGFSNKSEEGRKSDKAKRSNPSQSSLYRYLQVRVTREDSNRLKAAISSKDLSVQAVLVEALNLWMSQDKLSPLSDPGTAREKSVPGDF
jgi:hypothetical protein